MMINDDDDNIVIQESMIESVAQPRLMAARDYVSGSSYTTTKIYVVSFTLWTMTTTYETPVLFFVVCGPKFTQLKYACAGKIAVCYATFRSTISCIVTEIFAIKLRSCPKFVPKFNVFFGPPIFFRGRSHKFLTQSYKFGSASASNMCQNSVMIDWATSEIRRWKKRKEK